MDSIIFPFFPTGLGDLVDRVVPELQKRWIFCKEYEGPAPWENLGLPRLKDWLLEAQLLGFLPGFRPENLDLCRFAARLPAKCGPVGRRQIPNI